MPDDVLAHIYAVHQLPINLLYKTGFCCLSQVLFLFVLKLKISFSFGLNLGLFKVGGFQSYLFVNTNITMVSYSFQ